MDLNTRTIGENGHAVRLQLAHIEEPSGLRAGEWETVSAIEACEAVDKIIGWHQHFARHWPDLAVPGFSIRMEPVRCRV